MVVKKITKPVVKPVVKKITKPVVKPSVASATRVLPPSKRLACPFCGKTDALEITNTGTGWTERTGFISCWVTRGGCGAAGPTCVEPVLPRIDDAEKLSQVRMAREERLTAAAWRRWNERKV